MSRALLLLLATAACLWANPELAVQIPGDQTMEFVWVEPGTFTMGSADRDRQAFANEKPAHTVTLTQGFWLGKYEVTQGQWTAATGATPWQGWPYVLEDPSCPATYISWDDCQKLCAALSAAGDGTAYRSLPTEAEWEYACRAGTTTWWSFGADTTDLMTHDWYWVNAWEAGIRHPQPVGLLLPNPWGVYDMHGNVAEWVQDLYGQYSAAAQTDPLGPESGEERVIRGGSFRPVNNCYTRSANRLHCEATVFYNWTGVRVVREGAAPGTAVVPTSLGAVKQRARGR